MGSHGVRGVIARHLDISEHEDATVVRFKGRRLLVDSPHINGVGSELDALVDEKDCRNLIVDFTGVADLSNLMLGLLVILRKKMAAKRGQMVLCGLSAEIREFFDETLLGELFEIRDTETDAFLALAYGP